MSAMVEVHKYHLPPTPLIPNSPYPLLHYPGLLKPSTTTPSSSPSSPSSSSSSPPKDSQTAAPSLSQTPLSPTNIHTLLKSNAWQTQWIFRYGPTQRSHYHSRVHECMVVLSGSATIRFGVADTIRNPQLDGYGRANTDEELAESTVGGAWERIPSGVGVGVDVVERDGRVGDGQSVGGGDGGEASKRVVRGEEGVVELDAKAGDVFILPAGVAHKTFNTAPSADFALLTPGDGHHVLSPTARDGDIIKALQDVKLDGFTMMGAYPAEREGEWDFAVGGEDKGVYERVWGVKRPERDPVLGGSAEGLVGSWRAKGKREHKL